MINPNNISILYMEDNEGVARLFQKRLERLGYNIKIGNDGEEGLSLYKKDSYDLVVVDHEMPIKNGLDVIRDITEDEIHPPIIMVTGAGNEKVAVEAMKLGAKDYIVKDIDMSYLELLPSVLERTLINHRIFEEKKKAEEELLKLRKAVNNSSDVIFMTDKERKFTFVNTEFTVLYEWKETEVVNKKTPEVLNSFHITKKEMDNFWKALEKKDTVIKEWINQSKSGKILNIESSTNAILDEKGNIIGYLAIQRDITERKRLERLREDVERIVRHDLKAPLTGIIGFSDYLMEDNTLTDEAKEYISYIQQGSYKMLHMINHSLDLFKMEEGTYNLQPVEVNIVPILHKLHGEFKAYQDYNNISIRYFVNDKALSLTEDSYIVMGEELLLESMLANLIKNAFESSNDGSEVTVSITDNDCHMIVIHNDIAIDKDIRDRFFERYVTKGKSQGTGLGTYSAKLIVDTHGGSISFNTSEESGTDLIVSLPKSY